MTIENWRIFVGKNKDWRKFQDIEFENLVTTLTDMAIEYNWSTYVGGSNLPFSIVLSNNRHNDSDANFGIRLDGKTKSYLFTPLASHNPNQMKPSEFNIYIGNTVNSCEEYLWRLLEDYKLKNGNPTPTQQHFDYKFPSSAETTKYTKELVNKTRWYQGDKI